MKLFIARGTTSQAAYERLFDRVKENDGPDVFHVFLVPDRYTVGVERDLVKNCFPNGYAHADVVSFSRFAVKNVKNGKDCLSKEGTVVLLRKVLQRTETKYYKKLYGYGFAKELFAAIASLRTAGITVEDILAEAEKTEGVLGEKHLHAVILTLQHPHEVGTRRVAVHLRRTVRIQRQSTVSDARMPKRAPHAARLPPLPRTHEGIRRAIQREVSVFVRAPHVWLRPFHLHGLRRAGMADRRCTVRMDAVDEDVFRSDLGD